MAWFASSTQLRATNKRLQKGGSTNGKSYKTCGAEYQWKWGSYRGDRIGLFTYNNLHESGYVDVDYMTYENKTIQ